MFAIFYVAIPVGAAVGFLLGGALERSFGWRVAFLAVGLPGLALAALATTMPEPRAAGGTRTAGALDTLGVTLRALAGNRRYAGTVLGYAVYTFAIGGLAVWMPTFLERVRGRELASADFFVGAVTAVAGLGGTFVGGYLGDRLTARVREGHLWLSGVSTLLAVWPPQVDE